MVLWQFYVFVAISGAVGGAVGAAVTLYMQREKQS